MSKLFGTGICLSLLMIVLTAITMSGTKELYIDVEDLQTGIGLLDRIEEGTRDTLVYKTADGEDLSIDLYEPLNHTYDLTPVVVFLHGGSWVAGSKETIANGDRKQLVHELRSAGYAVAAVQYRTLRPSVNFPKNIIDCQDSVRFLRSISQERHYDPDNIGYWGTSAGAHLAMLATVLDEYDNQGDPSLEGYSCDVSYVVNYYGPSALPALMEAKSVIDDNMVRSLFNTSNLGGSVESILDQAEHFSPINHIHKLEVPLLVIHGTEDRVVPHEHSVRLVEVLKAKGSGNTCVLRSVEGAGHGILKESKSSPEDREMIIAETVKFIQSQK